MKIPFMDIVSERNIAIDILHDRANSPSYVVRIAGATHASFSDLTIALRALRRLGLLGTVDAARMRNLTSTYAVAFFDRYLLEQHASRLHELSSEHPEVALISNTSSAEPQRGDSKARH